MQAKAGLKIVRVGRQRLKQKPAKALRLPRNAPEIDLTIRFVGAAVMALAQQVTQSGMRLKTGRFTCRAVLKASRYSQAPAGDRSGSDSRAG